jgi:hypothetical protein
LQPRGENNKLFLFSAISTSGMQQWQNEAPNFSKFMLVNVYLIEYTINLENY